MSSNSDNTQTQTESPVKKSFKSRKNNGDKQRLSFKELLFELNNLKKYKHSPKADLYERGNTYVIRMELPGLSLQDINVQLRDSQFVLVSGTKQNLENQEQDNIIYSECYYGNFMRRVKVPQPVHKDSLTKSMNEGVLLLTFTKLPKVEEALDARLDESDTALPSPTLETIPEGKVIDFNNLGDFKSTSWADEM